MRTLVIGDIHGGLRALLQIMERASVTTDDELIFLGDYVDGWSESAGVLQYLMGLQIKQPCIFIKGNHDEWCEEWLRTGKADSTWLFHGGQLTVEGYSSLSDPQRSEHLDFFEQMKMYHVDGQNRLFIHAGFTSMHGPEQEFYSSNFSWDRTLWETALAMDKKIMKNSLLFPKRLKLFNEIFIGHTPTINFNSDIPIHACNLWNVDTGSAFYGKLTIMDVETKQFWQSDAVKDLYPNEKGRNKD